MTPFVSKKHPWGSLFSWFNLGAVFAINGRVIGLDLFDCPETMEKFLPKLVRSYALDTIDRYVPDPEPAQKSEVQEFLPAVSGAQTEVFKAAGEGEDVRLSGKGIDSAAGVIESMEN